MSEIGSASTEPAGRVPAVLRGVLGVAAAVALFVMMALTFVDVFGRKFLGQSLVGGVELTELLMLTVIFCGLPLASLAGEHVLFDLADGLLPASARRWRGLVAQIVTALLLMAVAVIVWIRAERTQSMGDVTAQLLIPVAPFHYAAASLIAVGAAVHLYLAADMARRLATR